MWLVKIWGDSRWISKTVLLLMFALFSVGVTLFQLLPAYELFFNSQRSLEPHPALWAFLPWSKLITFLAPDFFGNHSTANYWGPQDYTSNTGFAGVIGFIFAGFGLTGVRKSRKVFYLLLMLVVSLGLSFPTILSVSLWESNLFGMKASSAHRALVIFNLSIALLVGFGVDRYLTSKRINLKSGFWFVYSVLFGFGLWAAYKFFCYKRYS